MIDPSPTSERIWPIPRATLLRAMQLRGWDMGDLAQHAGLSRATIREVLDREGGAKRTFRRILEALRQHPPLEGAEALLEASDG